MKASGIDLVEDHTNDVLGWYASKGDVLGLEEFLQTFVQGAVPHLLLCSYLIRPLQVHSLTANAIYISKRTKRASQPVPSLRVPFHFSTPTKVLVDRHP
jgi:hypothetical protein